MVGRVRVVHGRRELAEGADGLLPGAMKCSELDTDPDDRPPTPERGVGSRRSW